MRTLQRIGVVGLGSMGLPVARRLAAAGFHLSVFDVRPEATARFVAEHGGAAAGSLAALARGSDAVITLLPDGAAVRRVVLGSGSDAEDRLADGLAPQTVLIDMGSSSPTGTQALGTALAARSIAMLDAPVSGGVTRAAAGTLSIMVGGEADVIERCRPLFAAIGARVFVTGPLGSGHAVKALNNLVSAAGLIAATEALLIGRRFGLDPAMMIEVFNASTARNNSTENKFNQFVLSRTFASGFALDLMVKDLATAVELAQSTETPAPFSVACRGLWAAARADLEPAADHTAVVRWFEQRAGTVLTRKED